MRPRLPRRGRCFNPHRLPRAGATWRTEPKKTVRKTGCFNPHRLPRAGATNLPKDAQQGYNCFNPHRLPRAGATGLRCKARKGRKVSILTGSPEPVRHGAPQALQNQTSFNPHRLPRAGATVDAPGLHVRPGVSILTGSPEPVRHTRIRQNSPALMFQSSPAPQSRCDPQMSDADLAVQVFQSSPAPQSRCDAEKTYREATATAEFQSSPAPQSRCDLGQSLLAGNRLRGFGFQSSPAPQSRCDRRSGASRSPWPPGFNPHRLPRAGATATAFDLGRPSCRFQSSPAPQSRCDLSGAARGLKRALPFQSSPAPQSRCDDASGSASAVSTCFNPHRLPRAGATSPGPLGALKGLCRFNPHRLPRAGATMPAARRPQCQLVSILTGSPEPVRRNSSATRFPTRCFNPHRLPRAGATR